MFSYIYIASPYMHQTPEIRQERYERVRAFTARLMSQGVVAFSPIVHCHPMATEHQLPKDWDFWKHIDEVFLSRASMLCVLLLDGWRESRGVTYEREFAKRLKIPEVLAEPDDALLNFLPPSCFGERT